MQHDTEFRITIRRDPANATSEVYLVEALADGIHHEGTFTLPFDRVELENYVLRFSRTRSTVRRIDSPEMAAARQFGGALFAALMTGDVGAAFRVAKGIAQGGGQSLRVRLELTGAPELASIPWEFLYDDPSFLAVSSRTPIVRSLDVDRPPRPYEMTLPLRVLVAESLPRGVPTLATGAERKLLTAALAPVTDIGAVQCDWLGDATLSALNQKLRAGNYHILHFIGHGGFDTAHQEGALLFEDATGGSDLVGADRLATIVGERESLRLVVLNSCEGARSDVHDPFSGVAGRLIEQDVPAVIAMQFEITDRAAILFASEFYTILAEGKPVDSAVSEARLAILADQNDIEWATPALFMRGSDGHLFSIADAVPIARVAPPRPEELEHVDEQQDVGPGPDADTRQPGEEAGPRRLAGRLPAFFRSRPLLLPLLLAMVGIVAVAAVASLLLVQAGTPSLLAQAYPDRPDEMIVSGSGFRDGETVQLEVGNARYRVPVDEGGQFTTRVIRPGTIPAGVVLDVTAKGLVSGKTAKTRAAFPAPDGGGPGSSSSPAISPSRSTGPASPPPSATPSSAAAFVCQPPGTREPSILFFSDRDANGARLATGARLFCIDPDTGRIGTIPIDNRIPATSSISASTWAPAGGDLAFTRSVSSGNRDIDILTADGHLELVATGSHDDYFPAWSVAGDIAFVRGDATAATTGANSRIMLTRRGWSAPVTVLAGVDLRAPAWSPDGTRLTFFGRQDGRGDYDIGRITFSTAPVDPSTVDSAAAQVEWFGDPDVNELNPAWSPDGSHLAFVRDGGSSSGSDNDIFVASPELANPKQRTGVRADGGTDVQDGNPVWSPDGARLVFYRAQGRGFHLWLMNKNGTGQQDLMPGRDGSNLDPSWR